MMLLLDIYAQLKDQIELLILSLFSFFFCLFFFYDKQWFSSVTKMSTRILGKNNSSICYIFYPIEILWISTCVAYLKLAGLWSVQLLGKPDIQYIQAKTWATCHGFPIWSQCLDQSCVFVALPFCQMLSFHLNVTSEVIIYFLI